MRQNTEKRIYVDRNLTIDSWQKVESYFADLQAREINSAAALEQWLKDRSELEAVLEEEHAWRYIKMTCDTANQSLSDDYNFFVTEIEPQISIKSNLLDKKLYDCTFLDSLDKEKYFVMIRALKKRIEIFCEENVPIIAELQVEQNEYATITAEMTIEYDGKELTMPQASNYLKNTDRTVREAVYHLMNERRHKDIDKLNNLLTSLIKKRHQIALNVKFENYRDYRFAELGRFDYSANDCLKFHTSISTAVCALVDKIDLHRKEKLNLEKLKPWDLEVDLDMKPPLKPFETPEELINKTIACFTSVKPIYGEYLTEMKLKGFLDLDSRKGKAPGGYNYPLYESNIPFIFMNAAGNFRDVTTIVHEGGHAIHSFLSGDLEIVEFKDLTPEIAELASMSMELISMEHWNHFFEDEDELKRAKRLQLESIIKVLPWIATVDRFQHWIYNKPTHSIEDRIENWTKTAKQLSSTIIDWQGCEWNFVNSWQKQLHIFEVPFYYIEYGIAQLGAIAIWKNYKENPEKALTNFENALKLGYSYPIPKIYETAGIKFDFSVEYISELMEFVTKELEQI